MKKNAILQSTQMPRKGRLDMVAPIGELIVVGSMVAARE